MIQMQVHQINPNSVKFKIPQGMVTVTGPYSNGLRLLRKGAYVGMALFIEEKAEPKKEVDDAQLNEVNDDNSTQSSSEPPPLTSSSSEESAPPSLGGAKPLNGS